MKLKLADISDFQAVKYVTSTTISKIYPRYYPKGAVEFFLEHHCEKNIIKDIADNCVYICLDENANPVGTVTIKSNEICRLFVLPEKQGMGFGREMLDFAEDYILQRYNQIVLDASLPAKRIYQKRGYRVTESNSIKVNYGDYLCYDVMTKQR